MKKLFALMLILGVMVTSSVLAQRATAKTQIDGKSIEIEYGTPSLQGRDMLSQAPVGFTWRMGMNEATMLKTDGTLKFGDHVVAPGEYRLTAKRAGASSWHLVINRDEGNIEVPLQVSQPSSSVETFEIKLEAKGGNAGHFAMAWGTLLAGTGFTLP